MNRIHQEEMVNNIKVQQTVKLWRIFYNVFVPDHVKTGNHPWGTFKKYMKYQAVNLNE